MDNNRIQLIGAPCGYHGPYTFFKAFKYFRNGKHKILSLSDFFFIKLWSDLDLISIGEVQLLWMDKNSEQILASLRLYFLPENTPDGRNEDHGEDEVLAISEKVVLRVEDLLDRIVEDADWPHGLSAPWDGETATGTDASLDAANQMLLESAFDYDDIVKEKQMIGDTRPESSSAVVVLSYPRYCRYRGIAKRLEGVGAKWARHALVLALGGVAAQCRDTRVVFCKDTFDYPDLEGHELLCNHLAPNLKGRPRRKRKKRSVSPGGSESNESESSLSTVSSVVKIKQPANRNGIRCNNLHQPRRSNRVTSCVEEKDFLVKLHGFMKMKRTPIGRVPNLGFKEIDLYAFYKRVEKLGGYNAVTANRMWKLIYDEMGGDPRSTSAATCTRRHYERLLLQYEINVRGVKAKRGPDYPTYEDSKPGGPDTNRDASNDARSSGAGGKDKSPMSALRSVRPRGDKTGDVVIIPLPPDKENIPLSANEEADSPAEVVELIDISDSDSPAKIGKTALPALKKRKLEILKEGGLEVTAISSGTDSESSLAAATSERRASVIQRASPVSREISITVTPDVSHLLGSPDSDAPTRPKPARFSPDAWHGHRVTQSRSIYSHSEAVVYGNPKEGLTVASRLQCPAKPEVLDLRVTGAVDLRANRNPPSRKSALPVIDGRTMLGSNLEITVVDSQGGRNAVPPPAAPAHRPHSNHRKSRPREHTDFGYIRGVASSPHVANGRSRGRSHAPPPPAPAPFPAAYLPQLERGGKAAQPHFLPMVDPVYYQALYGANMFAPATGYMAPMQAPPVFAPTPEHLQLYKELMNHHHHSVMRAQHGTAGFLGLPRDGSTSITPVSQSAPNSK